VTATDYVTSLRVK